MKVVSGSVLLSPCSSEGRKLGGKREEPWPCLSLALLFVGAGQDVGRSCILVSISGKNVMLDCGMHMGYNDDVSTVREWSRALQGPQLTF